MTIKTLNKTVANVALAGLLSVGVMAAANAEAPKNSTYLELGGNAGVYSLNYERHITEDMGVRVGVGSLWAGKYAGFAVPVMANKYWGNPDSNHKFETGLGTTIFTGLDREKSFDLKKTGKNSALTGTATVGYKYMPKASGMTFKAAFTPIFNSEGFLPMVGVSVGHTF